MANTNDISEVIPEIGPLVSHAMVNEYEKTLAAELERATGIKTKPEPLTLPTGKRKRKDVGEL